jgi:hypothetical protein
MPDRPRLRARCPVHDYIVIGGKWYIHHKLKPPPRVPPIVPNVWSFSNARFVPYIEVIVCVRNMRAPRVLLAPLCSSVYRITWTHLPPRSVLLPLLVPSPCLKPTKQQALRVRTITLQPYFNLPCPSMRPSQANPYTPIPLPRCSTAVTPPKPSRPYFERKPRLSADSVTIMRN